MAATDAQQTSSLDTARHIKYWQRCHGTYLPSAYTANDSTRLTFAYFIVSALDLLSSPLSAEDRSAVRSWALSLQHPDGGFCGSSTHTLPGLDAAKGSANLAATFFALLLLGVAADNDAEARAAFAGVQRRKLLRWLRRLQREDGSFGQILWDGEPQGGRDMRHSYLVSGIRWMLRGPAEPGDEAWEDDVDVDAMVAHVRQGQTYDGGLAEASEHESHAGYAYCGIAALYMLNRPLSSSTGPPKGAAIAQGVVDRQALINFLAHRPFEYLASREEEDDGEEGNFIGAEAGEPSSSKGSCHVGYNGRWNKKADTCYCWWVAGALTMLDGQDLINTAPSRRYMLDITQHQIGGLSKSVGGPPDVFHSYLGLGALALLGEPGLKEFDVGLCCSRDTARKVGLARDGLLEAQTTDGFDDDGFWESLAQGRNGAMASTPPQESAPDPWDDKTREKFEGKSKSEYYDPCQEAAQRSYRCLYRNGGDKSMCGDFFQAYRDCKQAWTERRKKESGGRFW
ncbi:prenyltransferase and squalene oxidase repeat domain-containing protein [Hirsutella rhossiliensis]|uniref:Prenyltransferase and squalene oxidase repeat domain-containing protein n=1 Tax=Hirsutella rhossiliensis TaxID=111463 RepID=A0A9P8MWX0_9HYPO|nr:prenyltransferase and squalene oxidase repeat domain-containing protein [Hirsutella rhossiliensis]KAH0962679.1 prenyltransferase and squalene oxidase repeat domain-containing protein [Hirsutella rhossiliensis]